MFSRQVFRSARAAAPQRALALRAPARRSFAAAASDEVKTPIAVFGVDGTYATALVRLSRVSEGGCPSPKSPIGSLWSCFAAMTGPAQ